MSTQADATRDAAERFEALLDRCERSRIGALSFDDLGELGRLYRRHLARLVRLRARGLDAAAIAYVNGLCLRAHTALYVPTGERGTVASLVRAIPAAFARTWRAQVLAWMLLLAGMLVGGALVTRDPGAVRAFIPSCMCGSADRLDALVRSRAARAEFLARSETPAAQNAAFGSALFTHNTRVGLLAFATGLLAAVPTVMLQLYNGIILGAYGAIFFRDPWPIDFLAWILPHGVPELTAITLCAAGGLLLGAAVALPGRRRRSAAVRDAVGPALALVATAVPLLLVAALTESFVRESTLGTGARFAIAGVYAALLVTGLAWVRRLARRTADDTRWLADVMPPRGVSRGSDSGGPR
jgi:uncharacterized membrane protein SpoIIM required for sporulation